MWPIWKQSLFRCNQAKMKSYLTSWVQLLNHVQLFVIPWTAAHQASLSITNSQILLKLMSIKSVILLYLLSSPSPASILSQHQGLFQWVSSSHRWPKYWSFSFSISPPNEYSGLISFRIDWLDLLAVQGTLKSLLQHHSSKVSILQHSAFFIVQLLTWEPHEQYSTRVDHKSNDAVLIRKKRFGDSYRHPGKNNCVGWQGGRNRSM